MPDVVLLDAGMTVREAQRRLAQHGYWTDPHVGEAGAWLQEYTDDINKRGLGSNRARSGGSGETAVAVAVTVDDVARMSERSTDFMMSGPYGSFTLHPRWAAIRRQDDITIFWYARPVAEVLHDLSRAAAKTTVREALNLQESTSTPTVQATKLPAADSRLLVVLHGNDLVGVNEPAPVLNFPMPDFDRGTFKSLNRGGVETESASDEVAPTSPSGTAELAGPTVEAFPLLLAPQKVAVGESFDLEIGLSKTPAIEVTSTGRLVLRAADGATMIPVELQVVADGFDAPQGWRRKLEVLIAEPTKARVKVALAPLPQDVPVRLTTLLVHFVVGGVSCGAAARNIVVESTAGTTRGPHPQGVSWLGAEGPPGPIAIGQAPLAPDIEMDISKPDGNAAQGSYRCSIRNAHGVPVPDAPLKIELGSDSGTFAKLLIDQIRQWSGSELADNFLTAIGGTVADKLPPEFFSVLRGVAGLVTDRPITLQLNSCEAYIPWELALIDPPIDAARPPFLGAQVAMGRWILGDRGIATPPQLARSVAAMAVMAGMYKIESALKPLPKAIEEAKALAELYAKMPAIPLDCTAANFKLLLDATLSHNLDRIGGVECVHFAGHGEVDPTRPGEAAIYLSDGRPISPLFFKRSPLGKAHAPFIFLNACMVGTAGEMLGVPDGFPGNCLAGGFVGLVGPLWAVNDGIAKSFALEFYKQAFAAPQGRAVAEILRELRANYDSKTPVPSYLAYVFYGNPHLKLTWNRPADA